MNHFKSCSFFGHSEINVTDSLKNKLKEVLEDMIKNREYGYFYFGGFGKFDDLCWEIVTQLKQKYPFINRIYCLSDYRHLRKNKRPAWLRDEDYEEFVYLDLDNEYWYTRIYFRNIRMIEISDFVIFYVERTENSGAYKAMKYAMKHNKCYINMAW